MGENAERQLAEGGYGVLLITGRRFEVLWTLEEVAWPRRTRSSSGVKTVLGRNLSGCVEAGEEVIEALEGLLMSPAHNRLMLPESGSFGRSFLKPGRVALFGTAFTSGYQRQEHAMRPPTL